MLEICICENNLAIRKQMTDLVNNFCLFSELDVTLSLSTEHPRLVLDFLKAVRNPVLFFLDIDLGAEMDGIELARGIRAQNKEAFIVFFTTKSELAPMTFKYQLEAMDFIAKDTDEEEIKARLLSSIQTSVARSLKASTSKIFQIKHDDKIVQLPMDEILYIETTGTRYKLQLHTAKRRITMNGELKKIEEELDDRFVRCHQSILVNSEQIKEIDFLGSELTLTDGSIVPMSRGGKKLVKARMKE